MARILFLSEFCLLDRKSGAARSALAMMEALAEAGHDCHAVTLSLFDGSGEYALPPEADVPVGEVASFFRQGICHSIVRTTSTRIHALPTAEMAGFVGLALAAVSKLEPDLVLTYSGAPLRPVLRLAQLMGARTVFFIANASWAEREDAEIHFIDNFVVPSKVLGAYFCEKKAVAADRVRVVHDIIDPSPPMRDAAELVATRHTRTITMVNPEPAKGGGFFLHLVAAAARRAPDLRFMIVEGRWGRAQWEQSGAKIANLPNLHWHPHTQDMHAVYEQSAMLLMPTLVFEASGRVIVEAMQAGLPVLAMDRGGIAEQLDGGGFLFDCPAPLIEKPLRAPPSAVINEWLHFIQTLMRDDDIYARAVKLAKAAADRATPQARRQEAVATFEALLARPPAIALDAPEAVHHALLDMRAAMQTALDHPEPGDDGRPYKRADYLTASQPAMRQVLEMLRRGEEQAARLALENYLRAIPCDYQALRLLADLTARRGELAFAKVLAQRAADIAPLAGQVQIMLGQPEQRAGAGRPALMGDGYAPSPRLEPLSIHEASA